MGYLDEVFKYFDKRDDFIFIVTVHFTTMQFVLST